MGGRLCMFVCVCVWGEVGRGTAALAQCGLFARAPAHGKWRAACSRLLFICTHLSGHPGCLAMAGSEPLHAHCLPPQRDDAINAGFAWFREKGLIPANDDDSDDDVNYAEAAGVEW